MQDSRYLTAIERNLAELQRAMLNRTTILGIEQSKEVRPLFLQVCYFALFNDYIAHCIKIFERSKRAASFWYIYRTNQKIVDDFSKNKRIDLSALEEVSGKLKHIRDKTHFHLDVEGVLDTKKIWREAELTGKELSKAVEDAWEIITYLQEKLSLPVVSIPPYYKVAHVHERVVAIEGGMFKL